MNKSIFILAMLIVAAGVGYFVLRIEPEKSGSGLDAQYAIYSNHEYGIEFSYRSGPKGYVLQETSPSDASVGLIKALVLMRAEDAAHGVPAGGEGPATMSVQVFSNTENQQPQAWADAHIQYSNTNLKVGDVAEAVVGGVNAIRYMTDGLYRADTVVVARGEYVYMMSGAFLDENSDLRRDFQPLLDSVRFISQAE